MGQERLPGSQGLTGPNDVPEPDEIEVSLVGPGYGECALVHIGDQRWVVVDSCTDADGRPAALAYLSQLGVDPAESVCLIVVTHWHDDHIKGMADLVEACPNAIFCCAGALLEDEFLTRLGALEGSEDAPTGYNMRELFTVIELLVERSTDPTVAVPNRLLYGQDSCKIWSLSPSDAAFSTFLRRIGSLFPDVGEPKRRMSSLRPNDTSVVVLIDVGEATVLLGADLERSGWLAILDDVQRIDVKASVFKVPHHGSENAQVDRVWCEMLQERPIAVLTPWRRGGRSLPTENGILSILQFTDEAYITAPPVPDEARPVRRRSPMVNRTIRESGIRINSRLPSRGMVRLRKKINSSADWQVEMVGSARELSDALYRD